MTSRGRFQRERQRASPLALSSTHVSKPDPDQSARFSESPHDTAVVVIDNTSTSVGMDDPGNSAPAESTATTQPESSATHLRRAPTPSRHDGVPAAVVDDRTPVRVIRVAIADATPRATVLASALRRELDLDVVGVATSADLATGLLERTEPSVLLIDAEDPRLTEFLLAHNTMSVTPMLALVGSTSRASATAALHALEAGAVDVLPLASQASLPFGNPAFGELIEKIRVATRAKVAAFRIPARRRQPSGLATQTGTDERVIIIGASTGGTEAIRALLDELPQASPPVVLVQHMPIGFTSTFAEHLDRCIALTVKHAEPGDPLMRGHVLVASSDAHLEIVAGPNGFVVQKNTGPKVSGHRPSIDVLMRSAAKTHGSRAVGVILTGMGRDGADGLLALRTAGARTFAQDESTSVVFGMPRVAFENGGAERLVPLHELAARVLGALTKKAA